MGDWAEGLHVTAHRPDSYNSRFDRGIGPEGTPAEAVLV
jgi:hypothetical protein